ncbi:MAG: condensation domain-containing protein, partial [Acidobacteriota bacterium]
MGVFVREMALLYEVYVRGAESPLPPLPIQYADFAVWQREWLQGEVLEPLLGYWRGRLGGELPVLKLPNDRPRLAVQSYRGGRQMFQLSQELSGQLRNLSNKENATLFMTLLTVFQILLYRYSGQDEILVGTNVANRNHKEIENVIGFFVNTLVLRGNISGNPTFRELLSRVRVLTLEAFAHLDVPFEQLVEALHPERRSNHTPLFQVMFTLQTASSSSLKLLGLTLNPVDIEEETSPFDLTMSIIDSTPGPIIGALRYNADIFELTTIKRMLSHYETLLESVVIAPDTRIDILEMLSEAERVEQAKKREERRESKVKKLMGIKPKPVTVSQGELVKTGYLDSEKRLPLIIRPQINGLDLVSWTAVNKEFIEKELLKHGAILFRGFTITSFARFEQFAKVFSPQLLEYGERSSPRTKLSGQVYTSTTHPADQHILMHNEQSYTLNWPMKLWFYCVQPALTGGKTPIADSRKILSRLDTRIVEKFLQKGIMYVRNYGDGLGLPWQEVFQTNDKLVVEEHCRNACIEFEWKDHNRLRTRQIRPAIRKHPKTGENIWFNHAAFFHLSSLESTVRQSVLAMVNEDEVPFNTFYGDTTPLEADVLEEINNAYHQESQAFVWEKEDILMIDNMLVAHGREPFVGPRQIVVIMAEPYSQIEPKTEYVTL